MDEMKNSMSPLETDLRDAKRRVSNVKGPARKRKEAAAAAEPAAGASEESDAPVSPPDDGEGSGDD